MKITIPKNIFTGLFVYSLPDKLKENIDVKASSMIVKALENDETDVAFIPSCDLLNHNDLFVSEKIAVSFDGNLGNSYVYFSGDKKIDDISLFGDISSNEIILTIILFSENYNSDVKINLKTNNQNIDELNCIVVGDDNYFNGYFKRGISFADEFSQFLDYPYVNFVLASKNKKNIIELQKNIADLDAKIEDNLNDFLQLLNMSHENNAFIIDNFNSVYFELTQNEINGLNEMLRYPYLKGIIDDIVEVKFV